MKTAGIAFTGRGARLLSELIRKLRAEGEEAEGAVLSSAFQNMSEKRRQEELPEGLSVLTESLGSWTKRQFQMADGIFFIGAAGIAVRACAPFLRGKTEDPAVVVIDETGKFSISLLSGHLGGANELAERAAVLLGALPVITTATDRNGLFAPDVFARKNDLRIEDMGLAREAAAALLAGERLGFFCEFPTEGTCCPELHPGTLHRLNLWVGEAGRRRDSSLSLKMPEHTEGDCRFLRLTGQDAVLGIGCRKGAGKEEIEALARRVLEMAGLGMESVFRIATIDLKKEEQGLLDFASEHGKEICFFSAEELGKVSGSFRESDFVRRTTGVGNVCERAAVLAAGPYEAFLAVEKQAEGGVTGALALRKRIIRMEWGQEAETGRNLDRYSAEG